MRRVSDCSWLNTHRKQFHLCLKIAKADRALARSAFGISLLHCRETNQMRKSTYLRYRRFLRIAQGLLITLLLLQLVIAKFLTF